MIDGLVAEGKYLWHAFQAGNDIGRNTNNNTVGGFAFDAEYCTSWMTQRCNTPWVNERAITVQFDSSNVNVSIASFLIVRPAYAWIGYGAGYYRAKWNDVSWSEDSCVAVGPYRMVVGRALSPARHLPAFTICPRVRLRSSNFTLPPSPTLRAGLSLGRGSSRQ